MSKAHDQGEPQFFEKASYGILGFSRSIVSQMLSLFLMYFYTDVYGIPVQYIAAILLNFNVDELTAIVAITVLFLLIFSIFSAMNLIYRNPYRH